MNKFLKKKVVRILNDKAVHVVQDKDVTDILQDQSTQQINMSDTLMVY